MTDVRKLLEQYKYDIDPISLDKDLTCTLCKKLMIDAYQSSCGCQYCYECITSYLSRGKRYCCGGKEGCSDEPLEMDKNVTRSAILNKRLIKLKVTCPNQSCTYSVELTKMDEHLRMCSKQPIECPYLSIGCDVDNASKDTILAHLDSERLTHIQLLMDLIHILRNDSNLMKDEMVVLKQDSTNKDIFLKELSTTIACMQEMLINKEKRISILEKESKTKDNVIKTLKKDFLSQETQMMDLTREHDFVKRETRDHKNTMARLETQLSALKLEIEKRDTPFMSASNSAINSVYIPKKTLFEIGSLTLTIDRFNIRKASVDSIDSSYFYSHKNGYKLRMQVYPGGFDGGDNKRGRGTHLSVYVKICKGEYDEYLSWPCKYVFEISIINQRNGMVHHARELEIMSILETSIYKFNRPISEENALCGYSTFISHGELQSKTGLIFNNAVVIRCVVRPKTK